MILEPRNVLLQQHKVRGEEVMAFVILNEGDGFHVGITCFDKTPERIVSYTMARDARLRGEDHVKLVLDTFLNGRT